MRIYIANSAQSANGVRAERLNRPIDILCQRSSHHNCILGRSAELLNDEIHQTANEHVVALPQFRHVEKHRGRFVRCELFSLVQYVKQRSQNSRGMTRFDRRMVERARFLHHSCSVQTNVRRLLYNQRVGGDPHRTPNIVPPSSSFLCIVLILSLSGRRNTPDSQESSAFHSRFEGAFLDSIHRHPVAVTKVESQIALRLI